MNAQRQRPDDDRPLPDGMRSWFGFDDDSWLERLRTARAPAIRGRIGAFELIEEVSRGGQGIVYLAREVDGGRRIAVKRLLGGALASADARARFERELETIGSLDHPGVVKMLGVEYLGGSPLLAMEWVDGVPITDWAAPDGRRRPHDEMMRMLERVCEAVHHAHQRGVIHRDLKPSNILVDVEGRPRILDFGLAKPAVVEDLRCSTLTHAGQFLGTPAYASPEQAWSDGTAVDVRSDVYSLGVLFFEMLTGRMPYPISRSIIRTLDTIAKAEPVRPRSIDRSIDPDLDAIVMKAIAKDPDDRYQSIDTFAIDLRRHLRGDAVEAKSQSALYTLTKLVARRKLPVAMGALSLLLVVGFGIAMTVLYNRAEEEAARAVQVQKFLEETFAPSDLGAGAAQMTLLDMLDNASARIDAGMLGEAQVEASLRMRLADIYTRLWRWPQAEAHARAALALISDRGEEESVDATDCLGTIGLALTFQENPAGIDFQSRALELRSRIYGDDDPRTAINHGILAFALWRAADPPRFEEAEAHYHRAIELYEKASRPAQGWAGALFSYAAMMRRRGRYDDAERLYRESLSVYDRIEDGIDISRVLCLEEYGSLLACLGKLDEAQAALVEGIAMQPAGLVDRRLAWALWSLGMIRQQQGDAVEACEHFERSLDVLGRHLAQDHPAAAMRLGQATSRLVQGDHAERSVRELWAAVRETEPDAGELLGSILRGMGQALLRSAEAARGGVLMAACEALEIPSLPWPPTTSQ